MSCHNSGSECVLTQSRRGGNFRHYRRRSKTPPGLKPSMRVNLTGSSVSSLEPTDNASRPLGYFSGDEDSVAEQETGDVLAMDLRNPSDALQILARSGETHSSNQPLNQSSFVTNSNGTTDSPPQDIGPAVSNLANASQDHRRPATTAFDDYELVQRGLLRPGQIPELLLMSVTPSKNLARYIPADTDQILAQLPSILSDSPLLFPGAIAYGKSPEIRIFSSDSHSHYCVER